MRVIQTQKGVVQMGDMWDYRQRKMEIVWELAQRIIPKTPTDTGGWGESNFIKKSEEILKQSYDIVDTIFKEKG